MKLALGQCAGKHFLCVFRLDSSEGIIRLQQKRSLFIHQWKTFQRWQDLRRDNKEYKEERARVENAMRLDENLFISPEKLSQVMPPKAIEDQVRSDRGALPMVYLTNHTQFRYIDHSFDNIRRVREYKHFQHLQYDQRFIPERLMFLGPDLAAAHFIVHRGGAVKFIGDEKWHKRKESMFFDSYNLPGRKVPGLFIEAIDASKTELMFEGFDNFYDLKHIRLLSLANCPRINDWALSRVGGIFSESLEFLDLSGCKRISAKGLMGLRSLTKLRFLRLEGLNHIENIAKSALLLEEAIPDLTVIGLDYDTALDKLEEENKLLQNDRILLDAKGNAFVEDDNGRLFYVKGNVNERPTVCDDDKPLMTSTIRREIPAMPEEEFEQLDQMSKGKLRHYLVGSPSGYSWTEQVETILSFENKWKEWDGIPIDPKMLPKEKRLQRLGSGSADKPSQLAEGQSKDNMVEGKRLTKNLLLEDDAEGKASLQSDEDGRRIVQNV